MKTLFITLFTFCIFSLNAREISTINFFDLNEQHLNEAMQGMCPDLAIEFPEGASIPVQVLLQGNLISFEPKESDLMINIQKTLYARVSKSEILLSSDFVEWKPLLEFIQGNLSIQVGVQEDLPLVSIQALINEKK